MRIAEFCIPPLDGGSFIIYGNNFAVIVTQRPRSMTSRFSVSLDKELLERFDAQVAEQGYPTRSKAVADLIRTNFVKSQWEKGGEVAGAIIMVYDHHKRDLANRLTSAQHDYHHLIISSQHVHLDHDNCLEVVLARGRTEQVEELAQKLKAIKGVKYCSLAAASTGKDL
jgi:CopG family nickel-responsive transcriptional regulator